MEEANSFTSMPLNRDSFRLELRKIITELNRWHNRLGVYPYLGGVFNETESSEITRALLALLSLSPKVVNGQERILLLSFLNDFLLGGMPGTAVRYTVEKEVLNVIQHFLIFRNYLERKHNGVIPKDMGIAPPVEYLYALHGIASSGTCEWLNGTIEEQDNPYSDVVKFVKTFKIDTKSWNISDIFTYFGDLEEDDENED
jgi:hypothetical protein